ncbi:MAG: DUF2889 domain-containing protein [Parahaliea sp.]
MKSALSEPVGRQLVHSREIICRGYLRDDGLIDIEGSLRDISEIGTTLPFHTVGKGGDIHAMRLLMTIGTDRIIRNVEAVIDSGPTPYCPAVAPDYAKLSGLGIGPGFKRRVKEAVGDVRGCTHLTELVERMAAAAMQTIYAHSRVKSGHSVAARDNKGRRPRAIGTCHALRQDGELVRLIWPKGFSE